ncbi:MAG: Propeptide peptidase M4 and M36 [candidate division Zixibacteria bacterium RBG-1]|nr:MAG: Propeptide peptidase M4 and M36 [candidate division Zixibacteria bacterium RBG-1]
MQSRLTFVFSAAITFFLFICLIFPQYLSASQICLSPDSIPELSGSKVSFQVTAYDSDTIGCYLISDCSFDILENPASETSATFTGPCSGTFTNIIFDWQTSPTDSGTFHIVFTFRDTCGGVESCTTVVNLFPDCIIARIGEAIGCPGSKVALPIEIQSPLIDVGGFSLCIEYDPILMSFWALERGEFFDVPGPLEGSYQWNYLVWRNQPSTIIHKFDLCIVGIGRLYYYGGTCLPLGGRATLYLHFRLSNNELFNCFYTSIRWKRLDTDCMLNSFTDCSGSIVYVFDDTLFYNPRICDVTKLFPKEEISNCAKGIDGGVTFMCDCNWFGIGDININGFANEIGDAVLFANYFISGIEVFDPDPEIRERQIIATDVDHDGTPLTLDDFVYLLRILSGDTSPLLADQSTKLTPFLNTIELVFDGRTVEVATPIDLGAMWLVFHGKASSVNMLLSGLEVKWAVHDGQTKVLMYSFNKGGKIPAGTSKLLKISGDVELEKVEAAEYMGTPVNVESRNFITIPRTFNLSQNYPNPFNNSTIIKFALPTDGQVSLKIYNVTGQLVKEFNEIKSAGFHSFSWDGTNIRGEKVSSGVYLYNLEAENFREVKKMTLLK